MIERRWKEKDEMYLVSTVVLFHGFIIFLLYKNV